MKKCVLIYDDDPEILLVSKIILEQENYRVETRIFCDDVIKDIGNTQPDIILMDLRIPEMGGENAINLMKNDKATRDIPVLLFSANFEIEAICKRAHANGFLKKPFAIPEFIATIENNIPARIMPAA